MLQLNSSYRTKSPKDTFSIAQSFFKRLGISRVTDITKLDNLDIPVCVAIRPTAPKGSLIVTAGKGFSTQDALTGAAMESIELAFSEIQYSALSSELMKGNYALSNLDNSLSLLDLCPVQNVAIDLNDHMSLTKIPDILSGHDTYCPSELVYIPFEPKNNEKRYFGYHTNGLASGNTYEEAIIHAIFEVIERDILSFEFLKDSSLKVDCKNMPQSVKSIFDKVEKAGLNIQVRTVLNDFKIPFFKAYISDPWAHNATLKNAGYGCHSNKEIALVRAVTEAVQSRMSYIHGGREGLVGKQKFLSKIKNENSHTSQADYQLKIDYNELNEIYFNHETPSLYLSDLIDHLKSENGIHHILVARHTEKQDKLQVVKVIIPKMEFFNTETKRIGPRIQAFIQNLVE